MQQQLNQQRAAAWEQKQADYQATRMLKNRYAKKETMHTKQI